MPLRNMQERCAAVILGRGRWRSRRDCYASSGIILELTRLGATLATLGFFVIIFHDVFIK